MPFGNGGKPKGAGREEGEDQQQFDRAADASAPGSSASSRASGPRTAMWRKSHTPREVCAPYFSLFGAFVTTPQSYF
jgi:hypothetical protein